MQKLRSLISKRGITWPKTHVMHGYLIYQSHGKWNILLLIKELAAFSSSSILLAMLITIVRWLIGYQAEKKDYI